MKDKKIIFMGTPEFALPVLEVLINNYNVIAVVTQPDSYVGRKRVLTESPVKIMAKNHHILVLQPEKIRKDYQAIVDLKPDMIITCAYGQIIPETLIECPTYKTINVHGSLLPKLRGGAPIERAIMNGDKKTGITIMRTDKGMDSGDMIAKEIVTIEESDTYESLASKLKIVGANLLMKTLPSIFNGTCNYEKQDETEVTFASIIKEEDEYLDFNKTAKEIYNQVRALYPKPGCYANLNNERIKIYEVELGTEKPLIPGQIINIYKDGLGISTKDGEVIIKKIQMPGKKLMSVKDFLNGIDKDSLLGKRFS